MDASAKSPAELERELETSTRELAEAREHVAEALEQQAATSEELQVISSSPGALEPVFEAILKNATRICEAKFGTLALFEGGEPRTVALHGAPPVYEDARRRSPAVPTGGPLRRVVETKQMIHITDLAADGRYASTRVVKLAARAPTSVCRCSKMTRWLAPSPSTGRKSVPSPRNRSTW